MRVELVGIGLVVAAAGCASLALQPVNYRNYWENYQSTTWGKVDGRLLTSKFEERTHTVGTHQHKRSVHTFHSLVTYEYDIDGTHYVGDRTAILDYGSPNLRDVQDAYLTTLRAGNRVDVYYDPSDPSASVLLPGVEPRIPGDLKLSAAIVVLGSTISLVSLVLPPRKPRGKRASVAQQDAASRQDL